MCGRVHTALYFMMSEVTQPSCAQISMNVHEKLLVCLSEDLPVVMIE